MPHINELIIENILIFANIKIDDFCKSIPNKKKIKNISHNYLWNIGSYFPHNKLLVSSLVSKEFKKYIDNKISDNEKVYITKRKIVFDEKPEFMRLFRSSNMHASKLFRQYICINETKEDSIHLLKDLEKEIWSNQSRHLEKRIR